VTRDRKAYLGTLRGDPAAARGCSGEGRARVPRCRSALCGARLRHVGSLFVPEGGTASCLRGLVLFAVPLRRSPHDLATLPRASTHRSAASACESHRCAPLRASWRRRAREGTRQPSYGHGDVARTPREISGAPCMKRGRVGVGGGVRGERHKARAAITFRVAIDFPTRRLSRARVPHSGDVAFALLLLPSRNSYYVTRATDCSRIARVSEIEGSATRERDREATRISSS